MKMTRAEIIGTVCAVAALALVAYLVLDSWRISECRDVLRYSDFEAVKSLEAENYPADLAGLKTRLETGDTTEQEARCVRKIGAAF